MPPTSPEPQNLSRRGFLGEGMRVAAMTGIGGVVGALSWSSSAETTVWQIDPQKCVRCGQCATACVLEHSAVKCVQMYEICGYCELCTGYFIPDPIELNTGAENQLCPTGAIVREFIEDPYFEYSINEDLCIGCAKCVEGCVRFGNGSFYLQVRHDLCLNCNECSIARVCAGDAFRRVPRSQAYTRRGTDHAS